MTSSIARISRKLDARTDRREIKLAALPKLAATSSAASSQESSNSFVAVLLRALSAFAA